MGKVREVRVRQIPKTYQAGTWQTEPSPVVKLGEVGRWAMVRHADHPNAVPFVMSIKEWDKLPPETNP